MEGLFFPLKILEQHPVWLEDLFELSKRFHAFVSCSARVTYFILRATTQICENKEIRKGEKKKERGISLVFVLKELPFFITILDHKNKIYQGIKDLV
jgi:hypothetical protein